MHDQMPQIEQVQPMPVPTQFSIMPIAMPDGVPATAVQISSSTGVAVYFISRETALELASLLRKSAQTGPQLITPDSGLVMP